MTERTLKEFHLTLHADSRYTGDAAKAIISTVLFHRLFGSLKPSTGDAVGVTYPTPSNSLVSGLLNEKQREVDSRVRDDNNSSLHLTVKFYEQRVKKNTWFQKTHNVCWEAWDIELKPGTLSQAEHENTRKSTAKDLQRALLEIVSFVDTNKEHIPAITTTDLIPFPYEIRIK